MNWNERLTVFGMVGNLILIATGLFFMNETYLTQQWERAVVSSYVLFTALMLWIAAKKYDKMEKKAELSGFNLEPVPGQWDHLK